MSGQFGEPIDAATRYCAVYGDPVRHSASPAMQNAGIAELGLNWRYLAFEVHPDSLQEALVGAKAMEFVGLNLTVPHKLLAMEMVDILDDSAREWGAVNTIRFEALTAKGEWVPLHLCQDEITRPVRAHGFNTDADAVTRAIREDLSLALERKRVLLLGAGGAGRVAALKLAAEGVAELFLVNRTSAKAEALQAEIGQRFPKVRTTVGYPKAEVDLALNATSLGLKAGDPLPFASADFALKQAEAVYDMIYRPAETPFLQAARQAGCKTANGLGMLLYQGAKALELWSGLNPPINTMRMALEQNIYGKPR
jgi:shikimate dehydrogenase